MAGLYFALAGNLEVLTIAQFFAGAAWGCILVAAFTLAFAVGDDGREGTMAGVLFSALAVATLARMRMVVAGLPANAVVKTALQWLPAVCWATAGVGLLYVSVLKLHAR